MGAPSKPRFPAGNAAAQTVLLLGISSAVAALTARHVAHVAAQKHTNVRRDAPASAPALPRCAASECRPAAARWPFAVGAPVLAALLATFSAQWLLAATSAHWLLGVGMLAAAVSMLLAPVAPLPKRALTDGAPAPLQAAIPLVHVRPTGRLLNVVTGTVACSRDGDAVWRVVRDCIAGRSHGVLRSVQQSRVLAEHADGSVTLQQHCRWQVGPLRGRSRFTHLVSIDERERRISFHMLEQDRMMRTFTGSLQVVPTGPLACAIHMRQEVEGQPHILYALAGVTVLRSMLRKQCAETLRDLAAAR